MYLFHFTKANLKLHLIILKIMLEKIGIKMVTWLFSASSSITGPSYLQSMCPHPSIVSHCTAPESWQISTTDAAPTAKYTVVLLCCCCCCHVDGPHPYSYTRHHRHHDTKCPQHLVTIILSVVTCKVNKMFHD